jgi:uncharacterized membrane protein YesL
MSIFHSYLKEGPGVEKDAPKKHGLALFCDVLVQEFWTLIELNLIFVLACLPVVTIGPALGAMTDVLMKMVRDQNVYLWRDFWSAFRQQWKRNFLAGLPGLLLLALVPLTVLVYLPLLNQGVVYLLLFAAALLLCLVGGLAWGYIYPMTVVTDLPLPTVWKNALLLGLGSLKHALPALLAELVLLVPLVLFFPLSVPLGVLISFSLSALATTVAAWEDIQRYVALPKE